MGERSPNNGQCEWCQQGFYERSDRSVDIESDVFLDSECSDRCCTQGLDRGQPRHDTIDEESHLDTTKLTADSSFHEHMKDAHLAEDSPDVRVGKLHVPNVLKYLSCASKDKTRLTDDDNEQYGFSDMPSMKYKEERQRPEGNGEGAVVDRPNIANSSSGVQPESTNNDKRETSEKRTYTKRTRGRHKPKSDPDEYNFAHENRGYMVIIVNDRFKRQDDRDGAIRDVENLHRIARKFGFIIFNYGHERNLTKAETISVLRKAQRANHSDCDCFAFVVSSHGLEQRNPRANGKKDHSLVCSDDQLIFTSSILEMFNDEHCPTLQGKPKLFFIQACRGEELDHGAEVLVAFPRLPLPIDKTCGVNNGPRSARERRRKDTVDEVDTIGGPDSWAVFPSTSTSPDPVLVPVPGPSSPSGTGSYVSPQPQRYSDTARAQIVNGNKTPTGTFIPACSSSDPPAELHTTINDEQQHVSVPPVNRLPPYPQFYLPKFPPKTHIMPSPSPVRAINSDRSPGKLVAENGSLLTSILNLDLNLHVGEPLKPRARSPVPSPSGYSKENTPSLMCGNDMLVLYAIPQGMFAWRNQADGSWMINYLHEVLMSYDMRKPKNFLNVLTKVNALMSRRETNTPSSKEKHGKKAVSVIEHALTKDIFFQQKVPISEWGRRSNYVAV